MKWYLLVSNANDLTNEDVRLFGICFSSGYVANAQLPMNYDQKMVSPSLDRIEVLVNATWFVLVRA